MTHQQLITLLWLLLVALTLGGAFIGESIEPGLAVTLIIALTMAFKGRIIIDHFMELKTANRTIRNLMRAYFTCCRWSSCSPPCLATGSLN